MSATNPSSVGPTPQALESEPWKIAATLDVSGVLEAFQTCHQGISDDAAGKRLHERGLNEVALGRVRWYDVLLRQFSSAFVYLLLAASLVAIFLGEYFDAAFILVFLVINAVLGFTQEFRAEKALASLQTYAVRKSRVRRGGRVVTVPSRDVVTGDIVILDAGDMIPADGRFLVAEDVTVDESPLTGESAPVPKRFEPLAETPKDLFTAENIGFARTTLLSGDAELVVVATGKESEVGLIAGAMLHAEGPSAFEVGISKFSRFILRLVLGTIPLVFLLNILVHGETLDVGEFFLFAVALTVSVIPEALPLVTTLSLSHGALLLAKRHVVPRRLSAIEDLGSIDVLCTDKTGTITENRLSVSGLWGKEGETLAYASAAPRSRGEATSEQNGVYDTAIMERVSDISVPILLDPSRVDELPFDPVRRRESVIVDSGGKRFLVVRGAPESVWEAAGKAIPRSAEEFIRAEGERGHRVLAIAVKRIARSGIVKLAPADESGVRPVGILSFEDPLKATTRMAIESAHQLGVRVKIITGDSQEVAGWVGVEAGILPSAERVLLGDQFEAMVEADRERAVDRFDVFARTTPTQKLEIIRTLSKRHLVGFLGEGFNDAPALKMAHVGLAVDRASDIARDASDVVLLDHSLLVIIEGIKEGRKIFANSMKYLKATLTSNFGNFYALALSTLFVPFLPMLPIQVLLLNLLSDFPMISIATDTVDDAEIAEPKGYRPGEVIGMAVALGVVSTIFDFAFFAYFKQFGESELQTMWFIGSILTELILFYSIRTSLPWWRAKSPGIGGVLLTVGVMVVTVAVPFIPWAQELFRFSEPSMVHLGIAITLVGMYFVSTEIAKLLYVRTHREPVVPGVHFRARM